MVIVSASVGVLTGHAQLFLTDSGQQNGCAATSSSNWFVGSASQISH